MVVSAKLLKVLAPLAAFFNANFTLPNSATNSTSTTPSVLTLSHSHFLPGSPNPPSSPPPPPTTNTKLVAVNLGSIQRVFGAGLSLFRSSGRPVVIHQSLFSAVIPARSPASAAALTTVAVPRPSASATPILPPHYRKKNSNNNSSSSSNRNRNINTSSNRSINTNSNPNPNRKMAPAKDGHQEAATISADATLALVRNRRTYYALNKELPVPVARVEEIVKEALTHVPSSFNAKSNRVLALFGADHDRLWGDVITGVLKGVVPADKWAATAGKMDAFKAAGATILFFTDKAVVQGLQERFAGTGFEVKFPIWAAESSAMLQYTNWVALEAEGLGANLQHYNPLVDDKVRAEWGLPAEWELRAQLVIGGRAGEPNIKDFRPIEEMYRSHGV